MDLGRIKRDLRPFRLGEGARSKKAVPKLARIKGPKTGISQFVCGVCGLAPAGILKRVVGAEYVCDAGCLRKIQGGFDRGFVGYARGLMAPGWLGSERFGKCGVRTDLGHYCRSRWEANVARWLLWQGLEYCYEPAVFDLDGEGYCPDFWVREWKVWLEVKGLWYGKARRKVRKFLAQNPKDKLVIVDQALYTQIGKEYKQAHKDGKVQGFEAWEQ